MTDFEPPRRIQHDLISMPVEAEMLVYDERRHKAFCLNRSASVIWDLMDGERTVPQISAAASEELRLPVSEDLVDLALDQMRENELIEPASVPSSLSRRDLLQRLAVGSAMLLPAIAAIVVPTAAQAYSGCVDCSSTSASQARARRLQQSNQTTYDVFGNPVQPTPSGPQRRPRHAADASIDEQP